MLAKMGYIGAYTGGIFFVFLLCTRAHAVIRNLKRYRIQLLYYPYPSVQGRANILDGYGGTFCRLPDTMLDRWLHTRQLKASTQRIAYQKICAQYQKFAAKGVPTFTLSSRNNKKHALGVNSCSYASCTNKASCSTEMHMHETFNKKKSTQQLYLDTLIASMRQRPSYASRVASLVKKFKRLHSQRAAFQHERDSLRAEKKTRTTSYQALSRPANNSTESFEERVNAKEKIAQLDAQIQNVSHSFLNAEAALKQLRLRIPNTIDPQVPLGRTAASNSIISTWELSEQSRKIGDHFLNHDEIAGILNCWHPKEAAAISGFKFSIYSGFVAKLERALAHFCLDTLSQRHHYREFVMPYIVSKKCLEATGQLPKFSKDVYTLSSRYKFNGERGYLIPTGEVPLCNFFRDAVVKENDLPLGLVSHTPCFRAESGAYGSGTRGLLRQHIFHKVEMFRICRSEDSLKQLEILTGHAEELLKLLELPYRKILLCSGETGFSSSMTYDLEVWMPGQQMYREVSSCSNCKDFQARRIGLQYKKNMEDTSRKFNSKNGKRFCHTLNGSGLALGRTLMAILENGQYQRFNGITKVRIPVALEQYIKI
ncbi:serine--tRna ligase [Cardiosporidium cionae]|uniref:Serine--tRNA ligase n=1 Tax=Cardiosporidium cionae TaxID=476202 RepID=A0ABQ7JAB7_9APIC|nr:serine--tRna ligase [Cardiosporidium cionae]|eukprot:KAF8820874.1 serine--tRna ligase [Cardiosporidium cionae]